jgi:hypothetical protein
MQEVNFKKFIIFNLFYLRFCYGPQVYIGNSGFRICGCVPWCGCVRNIILLHTHPHTHHTFSPLHFSLHTTCYSCATLGCISVMNRDRPTFVERCSSILNFVIISIMFFTMGNQESLHDISLLHQGKSN